MDGPEARASIPMHVRAVDEVLKVGQKVESALHCQIRRALFWYETLPFSLFNDTA